MDAKTIAQAARKRIMDRIEEDRCIHVSSIEDEIERAIAAAMPAPTMPYGYVTMLPNGVVAIDMRAFPLTAPMGIVPPPPVDDEYR